MHDALAADVRRRIRDVPDFPRAGILFKDITPVLLDPILFGQVIDWMAAEWSQVDKVVGMESRGFLFAAALVERLGAGLVPARKKGKLPHATARVDYELEYGNATLEMHLDAVTAGDRVLIVDDLLATGGTARATIDLVQQLGGEVVGCGFLVELGFLDGRQGIEVPIRSLVTY